ncbi:putative DNA cross-link repair 1A protein [Trypanosoma grayi]|uniref:putative DNA cross-link repair 1A protein n=1 Tax=Trypanosoma grayi TaxID=71804 RepID=UPI0004F42CD1|nr:putative DNA cross-link repair 1A protein [Trypanosoma grayi]KEG15003.1 putative DNA cross-link repair 1A protein [Trypanosoma grayi]
MPFSPIILCAVDQCAAALAFSPSLTSNHQTHEGCHSHVTTKSPLFPVYIDHFNNSEGIPDAFYLLSHFHTDHMKGLSHVWSAGTIICDEVTRALVTQKYGVALAQRIRSQSLFQASTLFRMSVVASPTPATMQEMEEVGRSSVSGGSNSSDKARDDVRLYLLPAFHIPGSVMFFLETPIGNILYTGDFKYDETARRLLDPFFAEHRVDHVYIDDTWLHLGHSQALSSTHSNPRMPVASKMLPESELAETIEAVDRRMDQRVRDFSLNGPSSDAASGPYVLRVYLHNQFGKEHTIQRLATRLGVTAFVDAERYERLRFLASFNSVIAQANKAFCIELSGFAPLPADAMLPRVEVVSSLKCIAPEELQAAAARNGGTPHYGIVISGWARMQRRKDGGDTSVWGIPTTLHCTPQQIIDFIALLRPMSVTTLHYKPCRGRVWWRSGLGRTCGGRTALSC